MTLEQIYINESKRIRKVYLTNLANIVKKEDEIQLYFDMIESIRKQVKETDSSNEKYFIDKLMEINDKIEKIKSFLLPYYEEIKKLDNSQRILYNNIKDKHPDITDNEIQDQIMPHIISIDDNFIKDNKELYDKILSKEK